MAAKEGSVVSSVEFTPEVYSIIEEIMKSKEMSLGAAVRYLIKQGQKEEEWERGVIESARQQRMAGESPVVPESSVRPRKGEIVSEKIVRRQREDSIDEKGNKAIK